MTNAPQRFMLAVAAVFLTISGQIASATNNEWRVATEQAAARLDRLHTLVVLHRGEEILALDLDKQGLDRPTNIKSLSKTVLAALVGIGIKRGVFEGVDQPVVETLGHRVPASATDGVERITLGHLLSLQAGLQRTSGQYYGPWVQSDNWVHHVLTRPFVDEPGGRMLYSTGSSHLLSAALTESAGRSTLALAREWLGEPLNITIPAWDTDPQGIYFGGNNMRLSPRDLARIGELYRNQGRVGDQRLFPENWVDESWVERTRSVYTNDPYGYGWFHQPLAGQMGYYGRGYGGQVLYVMPAMALTVVMTSDPTPPSPGSAFLRRQFGLIESHIIPGIRASFPQLYSAMETPKEETR